MDEESPKVEDSYEAKYMEGGAALAHSKKRMPWWFFALLGLPMLAGVGTALLAPHGMGAALAATGLSALFSAMVALLMSHLRVVVTATHFHVQYGLWGPKVALADIEEVIAAPYDWKRFGGWGLRYGRDGSWCYSVPGGNGMSVEVAYKTPEGKKKRLVVSADNAAELVAAVDRARAAKGLTGVRVAQVAPDEEVAVEAAGAVERKARRE